ncbi:MAG: peptidoglycan-binding protein [Pseudomonadota bacterium]
MARQRRSSTTTVATRGASLTDGGGTTVSRHGEFYRPYWEEAPKKSFNLLSALQALTFFLVIGVGALAIGYLILSQTFRLGQSANATDYRHAASGRSGSGALIIAPESVAGDWIASSSLKHVIAAKMDSIILTDSVLGDPAQHVLLGIYERDVTRRRQEAALHFLIAGANGHPDAPRLFDDLNLSLQDYNATRSQFVALHELNGDEGLLRLGQHYLGKHAPRVAKRMRQSLRYTPPKDYFWPKPDDSQDLAYVQFHMASMCRLPGAYDWRSETANYFRFSSQRENSLRQRAGAELKLLAERFGGDQDSFCGNTRLAEALDVVRNRQNARPAVRMEAELADWDGSYNPCDTDLDGFSGADCDEFEAALREGDISAISEPPTYADLIAAIETHYAKQRRNRPGGGRSNAGRNADRSSGAASGGRRRYREGSGAQAYRNAPGAAAAPNIDSAAPDGLPDECVALDAAGECATRESALACEDRSKYHFNRGEADMAVGRIARARDKFTRAIAVGRVCQSEYGDLAAKRLSALNLTCEYTVDSLARISRNYQDNPEGGAIVDLRSRQRALAAKGYYEGAIDGRYGPASRAAARLFQREIGFSETGDLTPIETVYLICSAAQVNADPHAINLLGVMYVAGLGVVQNTDAGLRFLKMAANRGYPEAKFNLALIYGTGTIASSYRLCGLVENIQQADAYLVEAAREGHAPAKRLVDMFGSLTPRDRWDSIKSELSLNDFYRDRLEAVGEGCRPN